MFGPRIAVAATAAIGAVAAYDLTQKRRQILRNFPVIGHARYLLQDIRPEIQQYFIERDWDGRPYNFDDRSIVYARADGTLQEQPFGTKLDVLAPGAEFFQHSAAPVPAPHEPPRTSIGGPDCAKPYDMALMNVSAMSFGALSANAVRAMNKGAALGGFAHDTGEGGLSPYHLENGGDLVWELGTGYFGARNKDGGFNADMFQDKAANESVKMVSLKLSQGAKPGIGGVLPAAKVTPEIAKARDVPAGKKCVSPPSHRVFSTPTELIEFIAKMRDLSGGKPAGFKLCVGSRLDVLAICKAMLEVGTTPDFIIVDGSEGGTGAAPLEFEDSMGTPLTFGLMTVHNALVGAGLRDKIKVGASGKVTTGGDIVRRMIQGADYTNSARSMMLATGCIQALRCQTNKCPTGIATQNPRLQWAIDVEDRSKAVHRYQRDTVAEAVQLMAAMGVDHPSQLHPAMLQRNISATQHESYADLYEWLEPGQLLDEPPASWASDWNLASADTFHPRRAAAS